MSDEATLRRATEPERRGLVAAFSYNTVAANLVMAVLLIGGLISALNLTAQIFPTIDPGIISVTVPYPGATPPRSRKGLPAASRKRPSASTVSSAWSSTASENLGIEQIELKDRVDEIKVRNDIEAAVDRIADFPPLDAEEFGHRGRGVDQRCHDARGRVGGRRTRPARGGRVARAGVAGAPGGDAGRTARRQGVRDRDRGARRGAAPSRTVHDTGGRRGTASSLNLSSGEIRTGAGDLLLRTNAKRERGEEFGSIVLRSAPDGSILRLADVAVIRDGFADVDLVNQYEGRDSLFVRVQKSEAEDVIEIADAIKAHLATLEPPEGVDIGVWADQTEILAGRLNLLLRNGTLGFALVFLFLVLMLDLRLAFWVAMGVPISFMGAFLLFEYLGVNINMVSLFALIIVIGIVVDDAVVVGENIITEREAGLHVGPEASIAGVRGVFSPVFIGVVTTMAAFAPLLLVTGTFGQILGQVPVVVIAVLAMSLVEAFLILPAHLSHPGGWSRWPLDGIQDAIGRAVKRFRDERVTAGVRRAVRHRYLTLLGGLALIAAAFALLATGAVRFIFFPALEAEEMSAELEFPVGTPFATTREAAEQIAAAVRVVNEEVGGTSIRTVNVTVGGRIATSGGGPQGPGVSAFGSHMATVEVQLEREPARTLSARQLGRLWRDEVGTIAGVERLSFATDFFGGGDIEYELSHRDDDSLLEAVERLKEGIAGIPGSAEIQDTVSLGKRQYDIELTAAGEAAGLSPAGVARQLRQHFFGEEVHRIQRGREELKVMVRYPREQRSSTRDFFNVRIRLADGTEAPLSTVARVSESRSFSEINRVDGRRVVTVSADVETAIATPNEVIGRIETELLPPLRADYAGLQIVQAGLGREQAQDIASLQRLAMVALLVIYALLASVLRSYAQPFVVLAAIPFGASGAFVGHYLLGYDLSFISIFGVVALSGVVINDSLVLVHRYNHERRTTGLTPEDAVVLASQRRFRAIFLTTATTALGLAPMLFERSTQAQFLVPMAVSLATGIVFASFIILFLVPALLMIREDFRRFGEIGALRRAA